MIDDEAYHFAVVTDGRRYAMVEWMDSGYGEPIVLDAGRVEDYPIRLMIRDAVDVKITRYFSYHLAAACILPGVRQGEDVPQDMYPHIAKIFALRDQEIRAKRPTET